MTQRTAIPSEEQRDFIDFTLGDGRIETYPTRERKDKENGRTFSVWLADFSRVPCDKYGIACQVCGGGWDQDLFAPTGGWMPHITKDQGRWHVSERPCPHCVFGAFRKLHAPNVPWFSGWSGCSSLDLGFLIRLLKDDDVAQDTKHYPTKPTKTLREALDTLREPERRPKHGAGPVLYLDLHARLLAGIEQQELMEQYQTTSGRDRQSADLF